jgi:hypothetical protein
LSKFIGYECDRGTFVERRTGGGGHWATQMTDEAVAATQMPGLLWAAPRILVAEDDAERTSEIIRELEAIRVAWSTSGKID